MKFHISRTSDRLGQKESPSPEKPIQGAYLENGKWFIDIGNLEELINLLPPTYHYLGDEIWSSLIVSTKTGEMPSLEIYDDYRE